MDVEICLKLDKSLEPQLQCDCRSCDISKEAGYLCWSQECRVIGEDKTVETLSQIRETREGREDSDRKEEIWNKSSL